MPSAYIFSCIVCAFSTLFPVNLQQLDQVSKKFEALLAFKLGFLLVFTKSTNPKGLLFFFFFPFKKIIILGFAWDIKIFVE